MSKRRMTSRDGATLALVVGLALLFFGGAEAVVLQLWPSPAFSELKHATGTFESSGWLVGKGLTVRTLRLTLSGADYSYRAADERMVRLNQALRQGDRLEVWTQWVPGPFQGKIWQVQRGNEMLVSYEETLASERWRNGRYYMIGKILIGAGAVLAAGGVAAVRLVVES